MLLPRALDLLARSGAVGAELLAGGGRLGELALLGLAQLAALGRATLARQLVSERGALALQGLVLLVAGAALAVVLAVGGEDALEPRDGLEQRGVRRVELRLGGDALRRRLLEVLAVGVADAQDLLLARLDLVLVRALLGGDRGALGGEQLALLVERVLLLLALVDVREDARLARLASAGRGRCHGSRSSAAQPRRKGRRRAGRTCIAARFCSSCLLAVFVVSMLSSSTASLSWMMASMAAA